MATINKRPSGKWQATVRREGRSASKSFIKRVDAVRWAREMEMQADTGALTRAAAHKPSKCTMGEALIVFRDTVTPTHRSGDREARCIDALLKHQKSLCRLRLERLTVTDLTKWRDQRLKQCLTSAPMGPNSGIC